jgi:hypothetical protein
VGTRKLYEDDEEVVFDAKRPVILNGIHHLINRSDLLDRSLCVQPPLVSRQGRRAEQAFWQEFEHARPAIFGAILRAISGALANADQVALDELPRMADFAIWVTAAEPALGWSPGTFLRAHESNQADADARVIEAEPLANAIMALVRERGEWHGTATLLLGDIRRYGEPDEFQPRNLPDTAESVGIRLRRIAPNLRNRGIDVDFDRGGSDRMISIRRACPTPVTPVTPVGDAGESKCA